MRSLCWLLVGFGCAVASAQPFADVLVQPPVLKAPARGSIAGELAGHEVGTADLARGSFSLPGPFQVPGARGPLLASVFPSYSPQAGLSEWGMGWTTHLTVRRYRAAGDFDFSTDELTSPWGPLKRGTDGNWYPAGLSAIVKVTPTGKGFVATTQDGTRFSFDVSAPRSMSERGVEWPLTSVSTVTGDSTQLEYVYNSSGRPFLAKVSYGGRGGVHQYEVSLDYELVSEPWRDYRLGEARVLDRRVKTVKVGARDVGTGQLSQRWRYDLTYTSTTWGPAFYLSQVARTFASGEAEPPHTYRYELGEDRRDGITARHLPMFDAFLTEAGAQGMQPDKASLVDLEEDGILELEHAYDGTLVRVSPQGTVSYEPLPPRAADADPLCRPPPSNSNPPRTLARMAGQRGEPNVVVVRRVGQRSTLRICDRRGALLFQGDYAGDWELGPQTRLVDLNRDQRPDLIRIRHSGYEILENTSTDSGFQFVEGKKGRLEGLVVPNPSWIQDVNGDGLPDILYRGTTVLWAWYGTGGFNFELQPKRLDVLTTNGTATVTLSNFQLFFVDANGDGLPDLALSRRGGLFLFQNHGDRFVQIILPVLTAIPGTAGAPIVGDLAATGATEVNVVNGGKLYAVDLTAAKTGLLKSAEDGKGTKAEFEYRWAAEAPGLGRRPAILAKTVVTTLGRGAVQRVYDYASPKVHTQGRFLIGFGSAWKVGPLGAQELRFHHSDDVSGLLTEHLTTETSSALLRFSKSFFEERDFKGIKWLRPTSAEAGWRTLDGIQSVSKETRFAVYERELCPSRIETIASGKTLVTELLPGRYASLDDELHCLAREERLTGTHPDAALDFQHSAAIGRNALGQLTSITANGADGPKVLQTVSYDAQSRVEAVSHPGRGTTQFAYHPQTGALQSSTTPDGVVTSAEEVDPVSDSLRTLAEDRGGASPLKSFFRYDGMERLSARWSSVFGAEAEPEEALRYGFATDAKPAFIASKASLAAGVMAESTSLFSGGGDELASALRIPQGWAVGTLTKREVALGRESAAQRKSRVVAELERLELAELEDEARVVASQVKGGLGYPLQEQQTVQDGVERKVAYVISLEAGAVVTAATENQRWVTKLASDAEGRLLWREDQIGGKTTYHQDALGRLIGIHLPDGTKHVMRFDSYGRPALINRAAVGKIAYGYNADGLLATKTFSSPAGREERKVTFSYDATGRPLKQVHRKADAGEERTFELDYDGAGATAIGQRGRLTSVRGRGFEKTARFDERGLSAEETFSFPGWRTLSEETQYFSDGSPKRNTTVVKDAAGVELQRVVRERVLDRWGRLASLKLNGSELVRLTYDSEGKIAAATFASGDAITFMYDETTRRSKGYSQVAGGWKSGVAHELNDRGLVQSETFTLGADAKLRSYQYDPRAFLSEATDSSSTAKYEYDSAGLPTRAEDLSGTRAFVRTGDKIQAGGVEYELDDLGRIKRKGALALEYGPNGELDVAREGTRSWSYVYDEAGNRLLKSEGGQPVAAFVGGGYLDSAKLILPVRIAGRVVGVIENGVFRSLATDPRGTVLADGTSPNVPTPYGVRATRSQISAALDYVEKGYDADLGAIRMGVRDYDPLLGEFWTPDPLLLESLNLCASSPVECNLFGYARANPLTFVDPEGTQAFRVGRVDTEGKPISYPMYSGREVDGLVEMSKLQAELAPGQVMSRLFGRAFGMLMGSGMSMGYSAGFRWAGNSSGEVVGEMCHAVQPRAGPKSLPWEEPVITNSDAAKAGAVVPRGFASAEQFGQAQSELRAALEASGVTDATIGVRGSAVTGTSFRTGASFGPASDIDFYVESAQLTNGLKTSRNIPGFVHPDRVAGAFPELAAWAKNWSGILGRDVNVGGFAPGTVP